MYNYNLKFQSFLGFENLICIIMQLNRILFSPLI